MSSLCASGSRELLNRVNREPDERRAEGKIDEKRPAPAKPGSNKPADERTDGDGDADDRSPESERLGAFRATELMPQHRERGAELDRRAHALHRSRRVEDQRGWREAAQERRQSEDGEADGQHAPAPEPVRKRP